MTLGGAERVLEQVLCLYPEADLYSLIDFLPDKQRGFILNKKANTSFLQKFPFARKKYRSYLPFMPVAVEQFDLLNYDLIISISHAVAKGVLKTSKQLHICYCHTPIRHAWDLQQQYLKETKLDKGIRGIIAKAILHYLRIWDQSSAHRVNHFIAIFSAYCQENKNASSRGS